MGSGGTGAGGAGGSGGGYNSNGWGGTMGSGGNAYSGGGVGGIGTAGTMSSGAGGSAMGGFGNTGAGGSGMAGISTHSGETPAGFTPSAGDPRGTSLGMDAFGNYKGAPGYAGIGSATANRATTMTPKAQMEMFGYVKYPSNPPKPVSFSTPIPTQTQAYTVVQNPELRQNYTFQRGILRSRPGTARPVGPMPGPSRRNPTGVDFGQPTGLPSFGPSVPPGFPGSQPAPSPGNPLRNNMDFGHGGTVAGGNAVGGKNARQ